MNDTIYISPDDINVTIIEDSIVILMLKINDIGIGEVK